MAFWMSVDSRGLHILRPSVLCCIYGIYIVVTITVTPQSNGKHYFRRSTAFYVGDPRKSLVQNH